MHATRIIAQICYNNGIKLISDHRRATAMTCAQAGTTIYEILTLLDILLIYNSHVFDFIVIARKMITVHRNFPFPVIIMAEYGAIAYKLTVAFLPSECAVSIRFDTSAIAHQLP